MPSMSLSNNLRSVELAAEKVSSTWLQTQGEEEAGMCNMEPSLHLCSAPLAALKGLLGYFMPVLPTSYLSNDRPDMQQQFD